MLNLKEQKLVSIVVARFGTPVASVMVPDRHLYPTVSRLATVYVLMYAGCCKCACVRQPAGQSCVILDTCVCIVGGLCQDWEAADT